MSEKLRKLRELYAKGQGPAQVAKKRREAANKGFDAMKKDVAQAQPKAVGSSFVPGDFQARQEATKTIGPGGKVTQQVGKMEVVKREGPQYAATGDVEKLTERFDPVTQRLQKVEAGRGREFKLPANFQDRDLKLSEYLSLVDQIKQSAQTTFDSAKANVETFKTGLKNMQDQMRVAGTEYNDRLSALMKTFDASRADLLANIERAQNETGQLVNLQDANLQKELLAATEAGADTYDIIKKYATGERIDELATSSRADLDKLLIQAQQQGVDPSIIESIQDHADFDEINLPNAIKTIKKYIRPEGEARATSNEAAQEAVNIQENIQQRRPEVVDAPAAKPTNINLDNALSGLQGLQLDPSKVAELSPIETLTSILSAELEMINDPSIDKMFEQQKLAYEDGKRKAERDYQSSIRDINKAIEGEDFVPTSMEGLSAKVLADTKEQNLASLDLEKDYRAKMFDLQMGEERKKRNRLDGYLKAKLYAMGAQDSSAGLHLMSAQINAADTRLQMMETEQHYAMAKLNQESRKITTDFANSIINLNLTTQGQYEERVSQFDGLIADINKDQIKTEREKEKLTFQALKAYQTDVLKIKAQEEASRQKELDRAYKRTRDAISDAQKLSGDMGYLYYFDQDKGSIVQAMDDMGQPIPTFAREKENRMLMSSELSTVTKYLDIAKSLKNPSDPQFAQIFKNATGYNIDAFDITNPKQLEGVKDYFKAQVASLEYESLKTGVLGNLFREGSTYKGTMPEANYVLQCGEFLQQQFLNLPSGISTISDKISKLTNAGLPANASGVREGMVFVQDTGDSIGHVAMVNRVDGDEIVITEANYAQPGAITNTRRMKFNDPSIKGYGSFSFKANIQDELKNNVANKLDNYLMESDDNVMAAITRINKYETSSKRNQLLKLLDDKVAEFYTTYKSTYDNALEDTIRSDYQNVLSSKEAGKFLIKVFGNNYNNQEIINDIKKMQVSVVNGVISVDEEGIALNKVIDIEDFVNNLTSD